MEINFFKENKKQEFIFIGCDGIWEGDFDHLNFDPTLPQGSGVMKFMSESLDYFKQ